MYMCLSESSTLRFRVSGLGTAEVPGEEREDGLRSLARVGDDALALLVPRDFCGGKLAFTETPYAQPTNTNALRQRL